MTTSITQFPNITPQLPRRTWMPQAACRGSEVNFHGEHKGDSNRAKQVCEGCPVVESCLQYALAAGPDLQHGVWGGLSADERRRMLRKKRRAARR